MLRLSRPLLINSLGATLSVFLVCWVLKKLVLNISFMDPVHSVLHHVGEEFTNRVYGQTRAPEGVAASSVCLVDIGNASRAEIAGILNAVANQQPRLVAVDIVFDKKNTPVDTSLQHALGRLQQHRKLVMASWVSVEGGKDHERIKLHESDTRYRIGPTGYTNFVTEEVDGVVRHHLPQLNSETGKNATEKTDTLSFAAKIVSMVARETWAKYGSHQAAMGHDEPDWILYQKDQNVFGRFSASDLTKGNPRLAELKNKIVLVGSMSGAHDQYVAEDVHLVPLGEDAQMTGLEIHANIIAMLLDGTHLRKIADWILWLFSFPICWLLMIFFAWQFQKYHIWFHIVFKTVQFVTAALIVLMAHLFFRYGHIELSTLPLLAPIALAVDVLYFYEGFIRWLTTRSWAKKWIHHTTYFQDSHAHAKETVSAGPTHRRAAPARPRR